MSTSSFHTLELRSALSAFATGVTIVTTMDGENAPIGVTASSFNSVSMEPPLVLWSIGKTSYSAAAFTKSTHFSIHVLRADQMELSNTFAKSGYDKFANANHTISQQNAPHLDDFLVRFDCETWEVYEGGDHWIIVGKVIDLASNKGSGLVFSGGSYSTASPITPASEKSIDDGAVEGPVENLLMYNLARAYKQMGDQFHEAVHSCGLSVAEWRILASLQGEMTRDFPELVARTFVDPGALEGMVQSLRNSGLCLIVEDSETMKIRGTADGHARVEHLFKLAAEQEAEALGDTKEIGLNQLNDMLKLIVKNTNSEPET